MRIVIKRVYREEKSKEVLTYRKKSIDTRFIDTYEESAYFDDCTEVTMLSGEVFIVSMNFDVFHKDMEKAIEVDKLEDLK